MKRIVLPPYAHQFVEVFRKHNGSVLVDPDSNIFTNQMCLVPDGVSTFRREPFKILVANFGSIPIEIYQLQAIVKSATHPEIAYQPRGDAPSHPGRVDDGEFRKHHIDPKTIDTINKDLSDQRESRMSAEEKPTTAGDINIDVPQD